MTILMPLYLVNKKARGSELFYCLCIIKGEIEKIIWDYVCLNQKTTLT